MHDDDLARTIPLFEEQVHVAKHDVATDRVRVATSIEERTILIEDVVERGGLDVERVSVDRAVNVAPEPRQEGDMLIVSVVEERIVVEKRLFVIEELRIRRTTSTEKVAIAETVRTMRATVERSPEASTTGRETDG